MKSIALIHTVKTVANSFEQKLKDYVGASFVSLVQD